MMATAPCFSRGNPSGRLVSAGTASRLFEPGASNCNPHGSGYCRCSTLQANATDGHDGTSVDVACMQSTLQYRLSTAPTTAPSHVPKVIESTTAEPLRSYALS
jgi:hypothetical protein